MFDQRPVRAVGEGDVLEDDMPAFGGQLAARLRRHLVGVEELEDPLGGGHTRLQQVHHGRQLRQRLGELARVLDEGLHVADVHLARRDLQAAEDRDDDVVEVADQEHHGHQDPGEELCPERRGEQLVVAGAEVRLHLGLAAENLHQRVARVGLLDLRVELTRRLPHVREATL